jgi:hypothetical protein
MIPFQDYIARVQGQIERNYNIRIVTRDITDPLTGDLDGSEIDIDYAVSPELRLFLLAHLFGHTVQWNVNPRAFEIGQNHEPPVSEDLLPAIMDYEREAASYGLGLLHQAGITEVDQWLSDFTACDMAYLLHYYRTGQKKDSLSFWRDNTPLLTPRPIPPFTPTRRVFRRDGIVI